MDIKIEKVVEKLRESQLYVEADFPMANEVSFRAGGSADIFLVPRDKKELKIAIEILRSEDVAMFFMGNGSNFFVTDKGFRGCIIKFSKEFFGKIDVDDNNSRLNIGCGALMKDIGNKAKEHCLSGFEFASGIPGSFGGAIFMNAGAYDGEMKDIVYEVEALNIKTLEIEKISNEGADFGYRRSMFQNGNYVILGGSLQLNKGDKKLIEEKMKDLLHRRNSKQPIQYPSGGSFFKRPQGYFAGKLIQDAGLKGHSVGGAQVSEKHSGFIINKGGATATDIIELRNFCQKTVYEKFGVNLEAEVRILGEE